MLALLPDCEGYLQHTPDLLLVTGTKPGILVPRPLKLIEPVLHGASIQS